MQRLIGTILFSAWVSAQAQGGSAIITLAMPPPGGEGSSTLQTGTAFADGAAAMYYNPASLAELSRNTGSQIHFTHSQQDLLPMLQLENLRQDFQAVSGILPDPGQGYDLGFGLFRNHVSFGKNQGTDQNGKPFDSFESVYASLSTSSISWN